MDRTVDLVIIGGGINGCACAADAAMRGLSVVLYEKDDLASKTSSNSSKLIHGGLRYLEHMDFSLVKEALNERQRLMQLAPLLVRPLPFILPLGKLTRTSWMISAGLYLYDYLNPSNSLSKHQKITRKQHPFYFDPLRLEYQEGFLYYDCQTNDARLVIHNALQAKSYGAEINNYTEVIQISAFNGQWEITTQNKGKTQSIYAKALINASGAFVHHLNQMANIAEPYQTTLVQGSHLIVNSLYKGSHAFLLQHTDKRIIFTIPYQDKYTLIGTTDCLFSADPNQVVIQPEEITYLRKIIQNYFQKPFPPILSTMSGVRTLISANKDPSRLSRDYVFHFNPTPAPVITIYSGKITTYRSLAEKVINALKPVFPSLIPSKTANTLLIGSPNSSEDFFSYFHHRYSWLPYDLSAYLLNNYGVLAESLLNQCDKFEDLGIHFGDTLYQAEVDYLIQHEWAKTSEDILRRRTTLGLHLSLEAQKKLQTYLN